MDNIVYPLNFEALEAVPRNIRRTKVVRLARTLEKDQQVELVTALCNPGKVEPAKDTTGKKVRYDDLKSLLDTDTQLADPTSTYHLQEIGLLVAASLKREHELLQLAENSHDKALAKKALAMCVHSSCVSDAAIQGLFDRASERNKRAIVRLCAREEIRGSLTANFVSAWLRQEDDRKILACEILHTVPRGTSWFAKKLREIIFLGRVVAQNKSDNIDSKKANANIEACNKALRLDLMWKQHGDSLLDMIQSEIESAGSLLDKAAVFGLWRPLLSVESWKLPGSKSSSGNRLSTLATYVPWRSLLRMYTENLPWTPSTSSVDTAWKQQQFQGIVTDDASLTLLNGLKQVTQWTAEWGVHLRLMIPDWIQSPHLLRAVGAEEVFQAVILSLSYPDGRLRTECASLSSQFLTTIPSKLIASEFSKELFSAILDQVGKVFSLITPREFYCGLLTEESYETRDEYTRTSEILSTYAAYMTFVISVLSHRRINTGQQLQLLDILHRFSKRMTLGLEYFSMPLPLVTTAQIRNLIHKYSDLLTTAGNSVLSSLAQRIQSAEERGKSISQLNTVFSNVVAMCITGIQGDVEQMYSALGKRYPTVFGLPPVINVPQSIIPRLMAWVRDRSFSETADAASRIVDELFVKTVIPAARKASFGDDALFSDRPGHMFARFRSHSSNISVRASALESLELVRLQWFDAMKKMAPMAYKAQISNQAMMALLDFLKDWITLSSSSVCKALEAKRNNRHSTKGRSEHPETAGNAERSLSSIASFLDGLITARSDMFSSLQWKDPNQPDNVAIIQRAFRLWSAATYCTDDNDPLSSNGILRLDPYQLEPLILKACALHDPVRDPFQSVINLAFALRLNGKILYPAGLKVDASSTLYRKSRDVVNPWTDAADLFVRAMAASSFKASNDLLVFLEHLPSDQRASQGFLKTLEKYLDVGQPAFRKRLEQDFTRPAFSDRLCAMRTLLDATTRTRNISEMCKTLSKIAKAIENETHENRMAAITSIFSSHSKSIVDLVMPFAEGRGRASDREFKLFMYSPPKIDDWPLILEGAVEMPKILLKLLEDLLDSTDEKNDSDVKFFRSFSDEIFRGCLTWPCTLLPIKDERITKVQEAWFECAMELQWRLTVFKSGKAQALNTFRPMVSSGTASSVRHAILTYGFQCDRPFPKGKEETRAYEMEAKRRRREKAEFVVTLFSTAYVKRIGEAPRDGPLGRKPAMEKKRLLDLISLVQGEWVHCSSIHDRLVNVVEQVNKAETTRSHQIQVFDLCKTATEACITWGIKCRNTRPEWADTVSRDEVVVREKKRGGTAPPRRSTHRMKGRGGNNTKRVDLSEEDAPWSASIYFPLLPPLIARYWELSVLTFGIHHPAGQSAGRCLLRMFLRWNFAKADACKTRAERQSIRCETAIRLLSTCQSAVHLRVVQSVLKDFRQDLLEEHVFSKALDQPLLGKFSSVSPNEEDDEKDDDDDDAVDVSDKSLVRPFRLHGFYGYYKLTAAQGRHLAKTLIFDVEDPHLSVIERVAAANKLRFLPAVGYMDFDALLSDHFARRTAYADAVKRKKKDGTDITISPPLPNPVVETLFRAVLSDSNPMALFSLLHPTMVREGSSKTTVLIAERAVLLLDPLQVVEVIERLFARKGRDGLLVGAVKAFLRILFNFASQEESVIGTEVVKNAVKVLQLQWAKPDLHPDARVLMVHNALKALAQPSNKINEGLARRVLEETAQNALYPDTLRAVLLCGEPAVQPMTTKDYSQAGLTKDCSKIALDGQHLGVLSVRNKLEYARILISAATTCATRHTDFIAQALESESDKRKRGSLKKTASFAADLRALLLFNLHTWVDDSDTCFNLVFETLEAAIRDIPNEKETEENESRQTIYGSIIPQHLGDLATAAYSLSANPRVYQDSNIALRITNILSPLIAGLVSKVSVENFNQRRLMAMVVSSLVAHLSSEGRKKSLYRVAFTGPFKEQLFLLKKEAEVMSSVSGFIPTQAVDEDNE